MCGGQSVGPSRSSSVSIRSHQSSGRYSEGLHSIHYVLYRVIVLIVDMSSPEGASINDGIRKSACSLSYVRHYPSRTRRSYHENRHKERLQKRANPSRGQVADGNGLGGSSIHRHDPSFWP